MKCSHVPLGAYTFDTPATIITSGWILGQYRNTAEAKRAAAQLALL